MSTIQHLKYLCGKKNIINRERRRYLLNMNRCASKMKYPHYPHDPEKFQQLHELSQLYQDRKKEGKELMKQIKLVKKEIEQQEKCQISFGWNSSGYMYVMVITTQSSSKGCFHHNNVRQEDMEKEYNDQEMYKALGIT